MKDILLILFVVISILDAAAQAKVERAQYWFNSNFAASQLQELVPAATISFSNGIDVSHLTDGLHTFHLRFQDSDQKWSSTLSGFFYKTPLNTISDNKIKACEYWFDSGFGELVSLNLSASAAINLSEAINVSALSNGLHTFHIRFLDAKEQWSSTLSSFFYKIPSTGVVENKIKEVQYWFNNDFAANVLSATDQSASTELITQIDAAALSDGLHTFHIRFKDIEGQWSSTLSQFFYKIPQGAISDSKISIYQYWYNNAFGDAVTQTFSERPTLVLDELLDVEQLTPGLHTFHIRFGDTNGYWSSVASQFFYKIPLSEITENKIDAYRYWFANNTNEMIFAELDEPIDPFSLIRLADVTNLEANEYTINLQFRDLKGQWSVVLSELFTKNPLTVARFDTDQDQYCGIGEVIFFNRSVDSDTWHWDFGDGSESNEFEPIHEYSSTGSYTVTLKASNLGLGMESTFSTVVNVYPKYEFTEHQDICEGEVFTWQGNEYHTTGDYHILHQSVHGCDSLYVLTLAVNTVYEFSETHVICGGNSLEWFGNSYNVTGTYYHSLQTQAGCDSVYVLNLEVMNINTSVTLEGSTLTAHAENAGFIWINCSDQSEIPGETGNTFTPVTNGEYAVIISQNGCSAVSACQFVNVTYIDDPYLSSLVRVYPNPVSDEVSIIFDRHIEAYSVSLFGINGQRLFHENSISGIVYKLSMDNLKAGVYMLELTHEGYTKRFKLIKE